MNVSLANLKRFSFIDVVIIHSIDLSLYQVSVVVDGKEYYVVDKRGQPLKSHNKLELQALFKNIDVGVMRLRQQSAYDEMIGQPLRSGDNTLEVSLGNTLFGNEDPAMVRKH